MSGVFQLLGTLRNKLLCTLRHLRQQLRHSLRASEIRLRRTVRTDFLLRVPAALVTDKIEQGNAIVIAGNSFAADDAGARAQACQRLDDQRKATGEIIARTAVEPHLRAVLAGNDAEAVVLDLVQPLAAGRQLIDFGWEARRNEPGREGTLQHAGQIKLCNSDCNQNRAVILELSSVGHDACQPECVVTSPGPSIRQRRVGALNRKWVTMARKWTKASRAKLSRSQKARWRERKRQQRRRRPKR